MADKTVRYVEGQFADPNTDNLKSTPNTDTANNNRSLSKGLVYTQLVNQGKNVAVQVLTRRAQRSGNISQAETINKTIGIVGDITAIGTGFAVGGPVGGGIATVGIAVQKGLEASDIAFERRVQDLEAEELTRRVGGNVSKWSEKR